MNNEHYLVYVRRPLGDEEMAMAFEFGSAHIHMIMDSPPFIISTIRLFSFFWLIGNVCYQKELNGGAFQRVVNSGEEVSRLHIWI